MPKNQRKQGKGTNRQRSYIATLCYEQRSLAYVRIRAKSLEEAERKASEYDTDAIRDWDPVHGDEWVESVKLEEGNSHD